MGSMTRAEPTSIVTCLTNWDTPKMSTHAYILSIKSIVCNRLPRLTKHHQPFRLLYAVFVRLGIPEVLPVYLASFVDFILCPVANKYGLSTPFDNHLVSLAHAAVDCMLRHVHSCPRESLQVQSRLLPRPVHPPRRTY